MPTANEIDTRSGVLLKKSNRFVVSVIVSTRLSVVVVMVTFTIDIAIDARDHSSQR